MEIDIRTIRNTFTWGTNGKSGKEPRKDIILKDIEDDHLDNIIIHVTENAGFYGLDFYKMLNEERKYRVIIKRIDKINKLKLCSKKVIV